MTGKKLFDIVLIFIFFVGLLCIVPTCIFAFSEDNLKEAEKIFRAGNSIGAIGMLDEFISKNSTKELEKNKVARAYYLLVEIYSELGDQLGVENCLKKLFDIVPGYGIEETKPFYISASKLKLKKKNDLEARLKDYPTIYSKIKEKYPEDQMLDALNKLPPKKYLKKIKGNFPNQRGFWEVDIDGHVMIFVPKLGLFVDKYEVSYSQFQSIHKENRKDSNIPLIKDFSDNHPVVVTFEEAKAYCQEKGMRLLTESEWKIVAGREEEYRYAWGNEDVRGEGFYRANYESFEDGFEYVAPVESFEKYDSIYGVVNLSGNVWEWVDGGVCKGGGFLSDEKYLDISVKKKREKFVGFRCVKEIEK